MKRPGSAEGGGKLASLGVGSKGTGGPAMLKPLAPPPSHTPTQVNFHSVSCLWAMRPRFNTSRLHFGRGEDPA